MDSIITEIPEDIVPNTLIETSDNTGISLLEFMNPDLSFTDDQQEQYDWKFATLDCFKDEFYDDSDKYCGVFLMGYMTEDEAKMGHKRIIDDILVNGRSAKCFQS